MHSLPERARESFARPMGRFDVFSDVFGSDPDVVATTDALSMVTVPREYVGIEDPLAAAYYLDMLDQLRGDVIRRLLRHMEEGTSGHPDVMRQREVFESTSQVALANIAPRKGSEKNGQDFYVGVTFNGLEVYGVPLETLTYLRDKMGTLLRVPTERYFGDREQFRSARVAHEVRTNPTKLETVIDAGTPQGLIGSRDQKILPEQANNLQLAFVDQFGNVRLRSRHKDWMAEEIDRKTNVSGTIGLSINDSDEMVIAHRTAGNGESITCLREVPDGQLGLYTNVNDESGGQHYVELVRKWNDGDRHKAHSAHESIRKVSLGTKIEFVKV